MNDTKVTANNVKLPEMHTRPYVEYGVGLQKHVGDSFSGYGQIMLRNGSRNGISLTAGFRWTLPEFKKNKKDNNKNVKVKFNKKLSEAPKSNSQQIKPASQKTVIKTMQKNKRNKNLASY
jgi:hypothetical protein